MFNIVFVSVAFLLTVALVYAIRCYAVKFLLDQPNQRSSHHIPTPRGGGLAVVLVFIVANLYLYVEQRIEINILNLSWIGLAIAFIGFWDDHSPIPAHWRFLAHLFAAVLAIWIVHDLPKITELSEWGWVGSVLGTFFLVWMLNLFNFMDGIDGIAASEAVFVAFALAGFMWQIEFNMALLNATLGITCLGFLVWNWPPAKIFMGDVGSGFIGFMLAVLIILDTHRYPVMFIVGLILFALFVVDATYTLLKRLLSGQKWYSAHCLHAYQKSAKRDGHLAVVKRTWLINVFYLLPLAGLAFYIQDVAWICLLLAYAPLLLQVYREGAGIPD